MKAKYNIEKISEGTIKCYIETKFLWKTKRKEISINDFFMEIAKLKIMPKIHKMGFVEFLYLKHYYNLKNKMGDFNCPVIVEINDYSDNIKEKDRVYIGEYSFEARLYGPYSEPLCHLEVRENFFEEFKPSEDFFKALISLAYSGVYGSVRDEEICLNKIIPSEYKWKCTVCSKEFKELDEFFAHILDEKHKCVLLFEYPYDKELNRIKRIIFQEDFDFVLNMFSKQKKEH